MATARLGGTSATLGPAGDCFAIAVAREVTMVTNHPCAVAVPSGILRSLAAARLPGTAIARLPPWPASYDAKELLVVKQQKCIFHVGRSVAAVIESKVGMACRFGEQLLDLLDDARVVTAVGVRGRNTAARRDPLASSIASPPTWLVALPPTKTTSGPSMNSAPTTIEEISPASLKTPTFRPPTTSPNARVR